MGFFENIQEKTQQLKEKTQNSRQKLKFSAKSKNAVCRKRFKKSLFKISTRSNRKELSPCRHGFNQQKPTQPNTTYKFCWLLGTQQPTNAQLVLGTQQPTSIISKVGVVYPTPTTVGQCWVPNFFLKKIQHEKRIISASRVFFLSKKQACYG